MPSRLDVHRRAERSGTEPAVPARAEGGRNGSALRDAISDRPLPDDALRGLLQHAPYFHDGSAPDLPAVVEHYNRQFGLNLPGGRRWISSSI